MTEARSRGGGERRPARLIAAMCVAEVLTMLGTFAFPALLPGFATQWSLSNTEAGWINGVYFGGYVVAVPVLGGLTDRMDPRRLYLWCAAGAGVTSVAYAILAGGFWSALALRALAGGFLAGTFIPGLKALVDRLEGRAQQRAVAWYTASFSLGTAGSFLVIGEVDGLLGWRAAFALAGVACLAAMAFAGWALEPRAPLPRARGEHLLDIRPVLRNRAAMAYILAYAAHIWELFAVRSWMVAFLAFSLSVQQVPGAYWTPTSVTALTGLIAMLASVAGAELALRLGRRRVLVAVMWTSAAFAFGIGFGAALPYPLLVALCVVYVMLVQADSAALHGGVVEHADPARRGATMSVQSLVGFACGCVSPLTVGMVLDSSGGGHTVVSWGAAFASMGAGVALGPILLLALARRS